MISHEDISDIKTRVALLEAAHLDSTSKIGTLVDGFNKLNINLATLIASINTAVNTTLRAVALITMLIGAFWTYNTYISKQIDGASFSHSSADHSK